MPVMNTSELGEFLRSRRNALTPEQAGIDSYGMRRVPGLRREELARLAGVSVAYYTRLEQGQSLSASDSIIDALATALQLRDDERSHLFELARPRPSRGRSRPARSERPTAGGLELLAAMSGVPALILGRRNDVLAWNRLGHALFAGHLPYEIPVDASPDSRPNVVRMLFLDGHTRELYRDWQDEAAVVVASLRFVAGRYPDDPLLAQLIGELSMRSPTFCELWAEHSVRLCTSGSKRLHHPQVGDVDTNYQALQLPGGDGQRLITHTVTPGSSSERALRLLCATIPQDDAPAQPQARQLE